MLNGTAHGCWRALLQKLRRQPSKTGRVLFRAAHRASIIIADTAVRHFVTPFRKSAVVVFY